MKEKKRAWASLMTQEQSEGWMALSFDQKVMNFQAFFVVKAEVALEVVMV